MGWIRFIQPAFLLALQKKGVRFVWRENTQNRTPADYSVVGNAYCFKTHRWHTDSRKYTVSIP